MKFEREKLIRQRTVMGADGVKNYHHHAGVLNSEHLRAVIKRLRNGKKHFVVIKRQVN